MQKLSSDEEQIVKDSFFSELYERGKDGYYVSFFSEDRSQRVDIDLSGKEFKRLLDLYMTGVSIRGQERLHSTIIQMVIFMSKDEEENND